MKGARRALTLSAMAASCEGFPPSRLVWSCRPPQGAVAWLGPGALYSTGRRKRPRPSSSTNVASAHLRPTVLWSSPSSPSPPSLTASGLPFASDYHAPVLCKEVLTWLITDPGGFYLDCTLGGGGHSHAILDAIGEDSGGGVVAIDQDPDALQFATRRLSSYIEGGRFRIVRGNFRDAQMLLEAGGHVPDGGYTGMLLDLGVSSHQLDEASRGFSFRGDGPLDMRMGGNGTGLSADDMVNRWEVGRLIRVLKEYGEEPRAGKIARAIEMRRPLETTAHLREVVESQVPYNDRPKTLARVFQGIRIAVNGEMDALESVLRQATALVKPGGRLVVLSYHSLEDRPVKRFMRTGNMAGRQYKDFYGNDLSTWKVLTKAVRAGEAEVEANGRARSVSMRVAERTHLTEEEIENRADGPVGGFSKGRGTRGR